MMDFFMKKAPLIRCTDVFQSWYKPGFKKDPVMEHFLKKPRLKYMYYPFNTFQH